MTAEEHIAESLDSAQTAERLYNENRPLQAAEIVWCSVKHAINAIAVRRGWRYGSYGQKKVVIERLESEGFVGLYRLLNLARRLHTDSDHGYLSLQQIEEYRRASALLNERLLEIARHDL